jgi:RNA polymerase sigma-70 factor (ECF subfamily)
MPGASINRVMHFLRLAAGPPPGQEDGELLGRFVAARDEAAFAALVGRHGGMVFGVCRRLLDNVHDAEDAFQATFVILTRQAASIRKRDSLASWLYGVAYRVARKARAAAARRRAGERPVDDFVSSDPTAEAAWRELRPVIDEELSRLPAKYRDPIVLCYLEGKTNEEAARLLGWTKGTVSGRLSRARDLLRPRLTRRGLALPAGGLAALLAWNATAPAAVVQTTVRAVLAGAVPASAAALARGVIRTMVATQLMRWTAVATVIGLATAGTLWHYAPAADDGPRRTVKVDDETAPPKPGVLFNLPEEQGQEREALEQLGGVWQATAVEHNGRKLAAEAVKTFKVRISETWIRFESGRNISDATFKLDPSKKPKVMWLTSSRDKAPPVRGIYKLEDGRLTICVDNDEGKAEPTEFATRPGSGLTLMVLERQEGKTVAPGEGGNNRATEKFAGLASPVRGVAFAPDGKAVWACSEEGRVMVWDADTGKRLNGLQDEGSKYLAMALSPDGKYVLLAGTTAPVERKGARDTQGKPGWMALYSRGLNELVWHDLHDSAVRALAFSPDGRKVAGACEDGTVLVKSAANGQTLLKPGRAPQAVTELAFSPDGKVLAAADRNGATTLFELATGRDVASIVGPRGQVITALAFSPDGRSLVTAHHNGNALLWDVATGKEVRALRADTKAVNAAAISPDGKLLATADSQGIGRVFDLSSGKILLSRQFGRQALSIAFSPDGKVVAVGTADGTVRLRDVREEVRE